MRIGLVLPEAPQYSETFFNHKIRGLTDSGFEVIVFSNKKEKKKFGYKIRSAYPVYEKKPVKQTVMLFWVLGLTFIKAPKNFIRLFKLERKGNGSFSKSLKSIYINSHIITEKIDCLHFGFATMTLKRENVAKAVNAKMSVSFRGFDINIYPLKNPGCYDLLWQKADKVHSISDYLYKKALKLGLPENVFYRKITPAIDVNQFRVKDNKGIIGNKIRILTIGRLNWIKDYETAISAMKILKDKGIDFIYNIVGAGTELERLTFAVYQCGLQDRVFFSGKKEHKEINSMMIESDIYIQTSMQEGFCVSVLEAQASGLLCIVSDADGLKENIQDGVTGWIVKRRDPSSFASKIEYVINLSEEKRRVVSGNARRRVEESFTIEKQNLLFKEFFNS
ncbi:MAG TPA: glycosyltransferase family 4 protein [Ignavibacteria bacterium]|nr:glycosyltransferase family 4 protein [Ignavibacteria bacterium]